MSIREGALAVARTRVPALSERAVDRVFVVLAGWLMTGVFLDAWAHISRLPDSFWTPWHGILYSGLLACGAFLVLAKSGERAAGRPLLSAGYDLSLIGFGLAAIGGVGDAVWHTVFGIEFDIEAAVSPSHLAIAFGICLVVTGPARAAWARRSFGMTGAFGLLYGISIVAIILDYANPFARVFGTGSAPATHDLIELEKGSALFAFSLYAALVSGVALLAPRRGPVAAVWYAFIIGGNGVAMVLVNGPLHPAAVPLLLAVVLVSALLIAVAATWLRPSPDRPRSARIFAWLIPTILYAAYAVAIVTGPGTWWNPTFWSGVIAVGGIVALLMSAVAIPDARRT